MISVFSTSKANLPEKAMAPRGGGTSQLQWTELLGGALAEHCRQARLGREGAGRALWEAEQEL